MSRSVPVILNSDCSEISKVCLLCLRRRRSVPTYNPVLLICILRLLLLAQLLWPAVASDGLIVTQGAALH